MAVVDRMKQPAALAELFNAALAQHQAGAFADAERRYRDIIAW